MRGERTRSHGKRPGHVLHGALVATACKVFEDLAVAATLWQGNDWHEIHECESVISFEIAHGLISDRYEYNERCLAQAERSGHAVLGSHAGFSDLFVPVGAKGDVRAVIVCGPFATAFPTSAEILERWSRLTGRQGHPADPEFSYYLAIALSTLALRGGHVAELRRLLECLAALMAAEGSAPRLAAEVEMRRGALSGARLVEHVWDVAGAMVDERTSGAWANPARDKQRKALGLPRFPHYLIVGLFVSAARDEDPVDALVRRRNFQRACAELARAAGSVVSGRIGDHGVTFLSASAGPAEGARRELALLGERASSLAKRQFGFSLHFGLSTLAMPLPAQYEAALAAAEQALAQNVRLARTARAGAPIRPLGAMRGELAELLQKKPQAVPARFDRFLEAVAARCAHRPEPARAYLEVAFETMTDALRVGGALEAKGFDTLRGGLERAAEKAGTVGDLFAAYRHAVRDVVQIVESPGRARHERSLRRAEDYLRRHYTESVSLKVVAAVAGYAPNYFSELFHRKQGMTFASYLTGLRIGRAKELLETETLTLPRIAQISGFARAHYLSRVFKRATSETPMQYRARVLHRRRFGRQ